MLKNANYILPAAVEKSSSATNTDFVKEESYPCTSEGCAKDTHLREWLKTHAKVLNQEAGKCQRKRKRQMNEYESALKEMNKALRWFTKTVHCGATSAMSLRDM